MVLGIRRTSMRYALAPVIGGGRSVGEQCFAGESYRVADAECGLENV